MDELLDVGHIELDNPIRMATPEDLPAPPGPIVLELRSLEQRHPVLGKSLLECFGASVVYRLSHAPVKLSDDSVSRMVSVDRRPPGTVTPFEQRVTIEWNSSAMTRDQAIRFGYTLPNDRITENAAIGVMCLLINELEGASVSKVLQRGAGGDYLISLPDGSEVQVEVSGISVDSTGREARKRLSEKSAQVLTAADRGFASVTTFSHRSDEAAHSYLHHVVRPASAQESRMQTGPNDKPRRR
jgi:hypothetical protein